MMILKIKYREKNISYFIKSKIKAYQRFSTLWHSLFRSNESSFQLLFFMKQLEGGNYQLLLFCCEILVGVSKFRKAFSQKSKNGRINACEEVASMLNNRRL